MNSKIIKSKRVGDGVLDVYEFVDSFGRISNYLIVKTYIDSKNFKGGGAAQTEEIFSSDNMEEIDHFFDTIN